MPAIASSAPDIMIGQIAAQTQHIRVGSGGVMLPNHAPLTVAERFKVLEALYPGRIDLGLGRAPGTDQITSYALRRRQGISEEDDFLDRFQELVLLETRAFPAGHPFQNVRAMPADVPLPPIWLLGSSDYSARLAAQIGAGFSFAAHFSDLDPAIPMRLYRQSFKPSARMQTPQAILAMAVICADTDQDADRLAPAADLHFVRRAQGEYLPLASPEGTAAHPYTPLHRARIAHHPHRAGAGRRIDDCGHGARPRGAQPLLRAAGGDVRIAPRHLSGRASIASRDWLGSARFFIVALQEVSVGQHITLTAKDGHTFGAYRADPAGAPKGAIVVIQEIFGVNSHIRNVTDRFAQDGYVAIAPALFDRQEKNFQSGYTPDEIANARKFIAKPDWDAMLRDTQAAIDAVKAAGPVAVIGYCMGAIVKFADEKPKGPVMLHFGAKDQGIPLTDVEAIRGKRPAVEIYIYDDAGHGFNCDERGSYDKGSAEIALTRTRDFLAKHMKK